MSLIFNGTSSKGVFTGNLATGGEPYAIFAWIKPNSASVDGMVAGFADLGGPTYDECSIYLHGGTSRLRAYYKLAGANPQASSAGAVSTAWQPVLCVFDKNSRVVYYGVGGKGTPETSATAGINVANVDNFSVGVWPETGNSLFFGGEIAEVWVWRGAGTVPDDNDWTSLAAGALPETIKTSGIVEGWPLLTQAASQVGYGGRTLAMTSTAQGGAHPISRTADSTAPVMQGALSAGTITNTTVQVNWSAATDNVAVTAYETSLDGTTWTDRGNVLTYTFTGLTQGTSYTFRVRAKDAAGNVSTPLTLTQSTSAPDTTVPTMTGSITIGTVTTTSIQASWLAGSDNVGVTSYETSLDGTTWTDRGNVLTYTFTGLTQNTSYTLRVRAKDAAGNVSTPLTATRSTNAAADTTVPVMGGAITASSVTQTTYTINGWTATDNVGVTGYELSLDGGTTWVDIGNVTTRNVTGRTAGATDQVRVRAYDLAGNRSTALSASVTLAAPVMGTVNVGPLGNISKSLYPSTSGWTVRFKNPTTDALVLEKTNQSTNSSSVIPITDAALVPGTTYAYECIHATYGRILPTAVAA